MYKIKQYFSTLELIQGLCIAFLGSAFIYLKHWDFSHPLVNTLLGLAFFTFLLKSHSKIWVFTGAFLGLFWFWWIAMSLIHYQMLWAVPLELLLLMILYALALGIIAKIAHKFSLFFELLIKSLGLFSLSFYHPFGFDWFKPELIFIDSYLSSTPLSFAIILLALSLSIWTKKLYPLPLLLFIFFIPPIESSPMNPNIKLIHTQTSVQDKWNEHLHTKQFEAIFKEIDIAIQEQKSLIVFPESIFPIFLNHSYAYMHRLQEKSKEINIVIGGLYADKRIPKNSTYIFTDQKLTIASKVLLVPFGESNPLPDFLSTLVNEIFYDGAVDYGASKDIIDYEIDGITYRNAICFEATSEKLYEKDKEGKHPKQMIVLSNNGWFTPSIEPTLQKLLLQYYHEKYGTVIYHSVNMSETYVIGD
ncbi:Apolipoprotein N-acyltransferase [hydrothermal vent metagenome]|uniref:Apolipoprotein N-acyltransferase n=1 Tax=hydrothermal vent metagenome TaxID=652676 RepID=A0A1W1CSY1_9ZZZZ